MKRFCSILLMVLLLVPGCFVLAQNAPKQIRAGNKDYNSNRFKEAEISYRKALQKDSTSLKGQFNLGDALYKQKNYSEALGRYQKAGKVAKSKSDLAKIYHNMGNVFMQNKQYDKSVEAYKNALRLNPKDEDTRYNLSYALSKLQQQKNNQQQQKQQQPKQDQQQQQPKQEPKPKQQLSKQDAERMLNALNNNEKRTQEKVKKSQSVPSKNQPEQDW